MLKQTHEFFLSISKVSKLYSYVKVCGVMFETTKSNKYIIPINDKD